MSDPHFYGMKPDEFIREAQRWIPPSAPTNPDELFGTNRQKKVSWKATRPTLRQRLRATWNAIKEIWWL